MKVISAKGAIPYPTPYMEGLFPSLCAELGHLERVIKTGPRAEETERINTVTRLKELLAAHYEVLALFLAHPTGRLSRLLSTAVKQAEEAVECLIGQPSAPPGDAPADFSYPAICERIRVGIADWRLSINLSRTCHDLDETCLETLR